MVTAVGQAVLEAVVRERTSGGTEAVLKDHGSGGGLVGEGGESGVGQEGGKNGSSEE